MQTDGALSNASDRAASVITEESQTYLTPGILGCRREGIVKSKGIEGFDVIRTSNPYCTHSTVRWYRLS